MNSNIKEAKPRPKEKMKRFLNPRRRGKLKMTAAPYKCQDFMPSLLKGKSKMMGVLQILIGLIITSFGAFLFSNTNKIGLSKSSIPRFFITRYPFWTGACYTITGVFTILNGVKYESQDRVSLYTGVLGAMVSASGIGVLFYSLSVHQFLQCVRPSAGSTCIMSEILLHGILSILLILTITQFSITAITLALKCKRTGEGPAAEVRSTPPGEPRQTATSWKLHQFLDSSASQGIFSSMA
ncbi:membrane-spanning 4-domains subfamily A member 15-like [Dromiciops gliroides]|uniref:membrane-spanning 4-domains subfamily A member 15-like n=1 Tax=Dromiciops gliroides TaxID=33562 RepID=UPI001CC3C94B|nr:membrane-spanning 4-domains subfamily A member 15-like [Dromiciops gliroides]